MRWEGNGCVHGCYGCLSLVSMDIAMPGPHDNFFFFFFFPQSGHCTLHYILFFTSESPVLAVTVEKTGVDQNLLYGSSMGHEAAVEFDLPEECICSVGLSFPGKTYTCPLLFLYFCKFIFRRLLTKLMRKAHLDL